GVITTVVGNGNGGFSGDNGPALSAGLVPSELAFDSAGNLYIVDNNKRLRKVSNGGITTVAGGETSVEKHPATHALLSRPWGLTVDNAGNLYIAEPNENLILKVSDGVVTSVAGTGTAGFSGDNGPATSARLRLPYSVAVDSARNLYIADFDNRRIR